MMLTQMNPDITKYIYHLIDFISPQLNTTYHVPAVEEAAASAPKSSDPIYIVK